MNLNMEYWKSAYNNIYGTYDGLDWQIDKKTHEDALVQVKLYTDYLAQLNAEREQMLNSKEQNAAYLEDLTNTIIQTRTKLNEAEKLAKDTSDKLSRESKETLSSMLYDLIKGGTSFKDLWTEIWNQVAEVAIQRLLGISDATNSVWNLISNIFGFGGIGSGSGGGIPIPSGKSLAYATGGSITGGGKVKGAGTSTSDSILAYLQDQDKFIKVSNGEYVMNAKATRKYEGILQMMNMDKFADGGNISMTPTPYIPTLKNPNVVNKIAQQDADKRNQNATMEKLLGQQNGILQGIANSNGENDNNGQVVVLNTRASKEEVFNALASDPRALQKLLGNNRNRGFR